MRSSISLASCFKWKDSTMATEMTAMYTENFKYDKKAKRGGKESAGPRSAVQSKRGQREGDEIVMRGLFSALLSFAQWSRASLAAFSKSNGAQKGHVQKASSPSCPRLVQKIVGRHIRTGRSLAGSWQNELGGLTRAGGQVVTYTPCDPTSIGFPRWDIDGMVQHNRVPSSSSTISWPIAAMF